jgi:hypothetical protein
MSGDVRRRPASIAINKMRRAGDVQKAEGLTPSGTSGGGAGCMALSALSEGLQSLQRARQSIMPTPAGPL